MNAETEKVKQTQTNGSSFSRTELLDLHKRVLEEVRKLNPQDGFKNLVASGIYMADGKLAKEYGG